METGRSVGRTGDFKEHPHSHGTATEILAVGTATGIRALKVGAVGLLLTAAVQFAVVAIGGSVGLFADALHNLGDILTTIALWIAFAATRRAADRRYTFGYQRFEDLAGLGIVLAILGSGALAVYEGISHHLRGDVPSHLGLGVIAAAVGVVGNEAVAQVKIRAGRRIGSPSLMAEGQHSRVDGLASLAVVLGLGGVAIGWHWADAVVAVGIGSFIVALGIRAGTPIIGRLVDRVDPAVVERVARVAIGVEEVHEVHDIRVRWAGRSLYVLLHISLPGRLTIEEGHAIGEEVRQGIVHALPNVIQVDVHVDPFPRGGPDREATGPPVEDV